MTLGEQEGECIPCNRSIDFSGSPPTVHCAAHDFLCGLTTSVCRYYRKHNGAMSYLVEIERGGRKEMVGVGCSTFRSAFEQILQKQYPRLNYMLPPRIDSLSSAPSSAASAPAPAARGLGGVDAAELDRLLKQNQDKKARNRKKRAKKKAKARAKRAAAASAKQ